MKPFLLAYRNGVAGFWRLAWIHFRHWRLQPTMRATRCREPRDQWEKVDRPYTPAELRELEILLSRAKPTVVPEPLLDAQEALPDA